MGFGWSSWHAFSPRLPVARPELPATAERTPDVVYVPTPHDVVAKMLRDRQVKKGRGYDLGCGDGRIVVTAAKKFGCKATGFDIDPQRVSRRPART